MMTTAKFFVFVVLLCAVENAEVQPIYAEPPLVAKWVTPLGHATPSYYGGIRRVALSPDNQTAVTSTGASTAILWDVRRAEITRVLATGDKIVQVAFLPNGQPITGSVNGDVVVWHAETGQPLKRIHTDLEKMYFMDVSRDGRLLAAGESKGRVIIWDLDSVERKNEFRVSTGDGIQMRMRGFDLSNDGKTLLSLLFGGKVGLWNVATGEPIREWDSGEKTSVYARLSDDGKIAMTGTLRKQVAIWNLENGEKLHNNEVNEQGSVRAMAMNADGSQLLVGRASSTNPVSIWNVKIGEQGKKLVGHKGLVGGIEYSPDRTHIITGSTDGTAAVWDADGKRLKVLRGRTAATRRVVASQDGSKLLVESSGLLVIWDLTGDKTYPLTNTLGDCRNSALSHDGKTAAALVDNTVTVWQPPVNMAVSNLPLDRAECNLIALNHDGTQLAAGHADGTIDLWDVTRVARLKVFRATDTAVASLAFSNDGTLLLAGHVANADKQGTAVIWNLKSGRTTHESKQRGTIHSFEMSSDGKQFLTAGSDAAILRKTEGNRIVRRFGVTHSFGERAFMNSDGSRLLLHPKWNEATLYTTDGRVLGKLPHKNIPRGEFAGDGTLFWQTNRHRVSATNILTGKTHLRIVSLNDGNDWLAYTPDGLYDGSPGARSLVTFAIVGKPNAELTTDKKQASNILQLQQKVKAANHVPGLMKKIYQGDRPSSKSIQELLEQD